MNIKKIKTPADFIEMEQLELKYYSEEHVTPHEEAYQWHLANPNTGFVLEDSGRIAGFTDILPIKREIFDQIADGVFNDKYLTPKELIRMDDVITGDTVDLLLSCVVIDDAYRETDALKTLLRAHLAYYRDFESRGVKIGSVITSNVTKDGERFSERMGFERIGRSHHGTTLYKTGFDQLAAVVDDMKPKLEKRLLEYEKDFLDPDFCADLERLERRIAADFTEYGQSGKVYDRTDMISALNRQERKTTEIKNFNIRCLGSHAAVAHYMAEFNDCSGSAGADHIRSLRTSVWVREDGQWKILFHQGTPVGNEAAGQRAFEIFDKKNNAL